MRGGKTDEKDVLLVSPRGITSSSLPAKLYLCRGKATS